MNWVGFLLLLLLGLSCTVLGLFIIKMILEILESQSEKIKFTDGFKKIKDLSLSMCPLSIKNYDVILTGNKEHAGYKLGRIKGYSRLQNKGIKLNPELKDSVNVPKGRGIFNVIFYSRTRPIIAKLSFGMLEKIENIAFYDDQILYSLAGDVILKGVGTITVGDLTWINDEGFDGVAAASAMSNYTALEFATDIIKNMSLLVGKSLHANAEIRRNQLEKQDLLPQLNKDGAR